MPKTVTVKEAHLLKSITGKAGEFIAASFPRQPFILDTHHHTVSGGEDLAYSEELPIGEYELLLYGGSKGFFDWGQKEWEEWLELLSQRIRQFHHNPSLVHTHAQLFTAGISTAGPTYQRVGDLIATSHPLVGGSQPLAEDVVEKVRRKEKIFIVNHTEHGDLYVPTAPLHAKELWYLPRILRNGIESLEKNERVAVARTLALLFRVLHKEYPKEHFVMSIHTAMSGVADGHTWWLQLYQQDQGMLGPLPVNIPPERFAYLMHSLFAHTAKQKL